MNTVDHYRDAPDPRDVIEVPVTRVEVPRQQDNIDFAWLFAAFRRRFRLFLGVMFGTIALIVAFMIVFPPLYTGTARVTINQRTFSDVPDKESPVVSQLPVLTNDVDTEVQVMQSLRVVERVIATQHLDKDPEFSGSAVGWKSMLSQLILSVMHPAKVVSSKDKVVNAVLAKLDPERYLQTNAIDINFSDNDPVKAQRIANAFAKAYLDDQVDAKIAQNRIATTNLLSQIDGMRRQASDDAAKVQQYRIAHNLMSVGVQTLTEQEISNYDQTVAAAKAQAEGDLANLRTAQEQLARGSNGDDVNEVINSNVVGTLRAQRAQVSAKLADLEAHYGPKYPDLAQARTQLAAIDKEIEGEMHRDLSNLAARTQVDEKRLASVEGTLAATKAMLAQNNAAQAGLDDLLRAATVSQAIYEAYLSRFKESAAQAASQVPDAEIVSMAGLPDEPSFPVVWLFLLLGLVGGFLFGCAAVLLAEMMDTRLATAEDVERRLGRPYLGGVPLLSSVLGRGVTDPVEAVARHAASAFGEAFRGLRASINPPGHARGSGVLLVTSALPREGKTTIAAGLARTAALQGASSVMIDCDSRRRGLTRALRVPDNHPGLVKVLRGEATLEAALVPDPLTKGFILPIEPGDAPLDELLGGEAMDALLAALGARFQTIVLDAPALQIATTRLLATKADAIVLVVRWRSTSEAGPRAALRSLAQDQFQLTGVVLNRIDMAQQAKYGYGTPGHFYSKFKQYYA